jgi:hypothetical protein
MLRHIARMVHISQTKNIYTQKYKEKEDAKRWLRQRWKDGVK